MSHFAKIENGVVTNIIVAEQDFIDTLQGETYVQYSENTIDGNLSALLRSDTEQPLRGNYAEIGGTYDQVLDIFIPPQPYPSWTLSPDSLHWDSPVPIPDTDHGAWTWDENSLSWVEAP